MLYLLGGGLLLVMGLSGITGTPIFQDMPQYLLEGLQRAYIIIIILGFSYLGTAYGLWNLQEWALWVVGLSTVFSFLLAIYNVNIWTVIIQGIILLYLYSERKVFT